MVSEQVCRVAAKSYGINREALMSTLETGSASSLQTFRIGRQIAMVGDSILPEIYHLDGGGTSASGHTE